MGRGKMGELKRAAQQLGVTSSTLRQHGWTTASDTRVQATKENPPDWLIKARQRRHQKRVRRREQHNRETTASRLGIQMRAVKERGVQPGEVENLLAEQPDWLIAEQERRKAQVEREARNRLRRELTDALLDSVEDAWFQEMKYATDDAEAEAINDRWEPEVKRAKEEARSLVDDLTEEQVRDRIAREEEAARTAAAYRATRLARRGIEPDQN